ncbi:MAG: hypothetical protein ABIL68_06980 [bacterium]
MRGEPPTSVSSEDEGCFHQKTGSYSYFWNGKGNLGRLSPSGVYVMVLNAGSITKAQKVMLVR